MIVVSEVRCSDCLNEFGDGSRFAVIKEDKSQSYSDEERQLGGHLYQVFVCEDCSGWYDDPVLAHKGAWQMETAGKPQADDVDGNS